MTIIYAFDKDGGFMAEITEGGATAATGASHGGPDPAAKGRLAQKATR